LEISAAFGIFVRPALNDKEMTKIVNI